MTDLKKVYIVEGRTGEYSDRNEWPVAAYLDETMARKHAELAKQWYMDNDCLRGRYDKQFNNPYDPLMDIDYTGTDWTVYGVELSDTLPEAK